MSPPDDPAPIPAAIPLAQLAKVLRHPDRWGILAELAKGQALPVGELARRVRATADSTSKHLLCLKKAGIAVKLYGQLYALAPAFRPAPGSRDIAFGHCTLHTG